LAKVLLMTALARAYSCLGAFHTLGRTLEPKRGRALFIYTPAEAGKFFEEFARLQRPFSLDDPEMEQILHRAGWENVGPPPF
jgi:hypothetical protein